MFTAGISILQSANFIFNICIFQQHRDWPLHKLWNLFIYGNILRTWLHMLWNLFIYGNILRIWAENTHKKVAECVPYAYV